MREIDRKVLEFERRFYRYQGLKEDAIRKELGITPMRYTQILNALAHDPEAIAEYPQITKRVRRIARPK